MNHAVVIEAPEGREVNTWLVLRVRRSFSQAAGCVHVAHWFDDARAGMACGPVTATRSGSTDGQTVAVTEISSRLWCRGGPMTWQ